MSTTTVPDETGHVESPGSGAFGALAQFTLGLVQAMLRTGYYAADHPQAQKALSGLHDQFQRLVEERSELTYLIAKKGDDRAIAIDGYDTESLSLHRIMMQGMADLFEPKFQEFMDRWDLLSFSIKSDCSAAEFHAFIALMSQPPRADQGTQEAAERLTHAFVENDILHISTVFDHDIVGRDRQLPWRVEMALSRLRRDLRVLPLYERASEEELGRIKLQIIDDVIRPIRQPDFLKQFLVNCDLVAGDIDVLEERQVEREIIANLSENVLIETGWELVNDLEVGDTLETGSSAGPSSDMVGRYLGVLRDIADGLYSMGSSMEQDFLESLLERGIMTLEELPPDVRRAVQTRRLAQRFVSKKEFYLERLKNLRPNEEARKLAGLIHRILPDMIQRNEYEHVADVVRALGDGSQSSERPSAVRQVAEFIATDLAQDETLSFLLVDIQSQRKEQRTEIVEILSFIGEPAIPGLLDAYNAAESKSVRLSVFEAILRIGAAALRPLLERLQSVEDEWSVIHHILEAVADMGEPGLAEPIRGFLNHPNAHVRQAALTAVYGLLGPESEPLLVAALADERPEIRQKAVASLGELGSCGEEVLGFYADTLCPDEPDEAHETDALTLEVIGALENLATVHPERKDHVRDLLRAALQPVERRGILRWFRKPAPRHGDRVTSEIRALLGKLAAGPDA